MMLREISQRQIYQRGLIILLALLFLFPISIYGFPLLLAGLFVGFIVLLAFEFIMKKQKRNWLRYLSLSWLVIVVPSFGIMPLLMGWRLHYYLPSGNELGIYTGFTLTALYNLFIPTPELYKWDHPFPPVTHLQLKFFGAGILILSIVPFIYLVKRGIWGYKQRDV